LNFGPYETVAGTSRLAARFYSEQEPIEKCRAALGASLNADEADRLGLVTARPDELDWEDELRIALEERRTLSPDALTGLEASLRFGPGETMQTRVFGRLSAWQNWIFIRPNAVGEAGALKVFGSGNKARFNWERV
jgi:benzoyl-CoA-dihydrodiol lyase